jgi:hypothetical protein
VCSTWPPAPATSPSSWWPGRRARHGARPVLQHARRGGAAWPPGITWVNGDAQRCPSPTRASTRSRSPSGCATSPTPSSRCGSSPASPAPGAGSWSASSPPDLGTVPRGLPPLPRRCCCPQAHGWCRPRRRPTATSPTRSSPGPTGATIAGWIEAAGYREVLVKDLAGGSSPSTAGSGADACGSVDSCWTSWARAPSTAAAPTAPGGRRPVPTSDSTLVNTFTSAPVGTDPRRARGPVAADPRPAVADRTRCPTRPGARWRSPTTPSSGRSSAPTSSSSAPGPGARPPPPTSPPAAATSSLLEKDRFPRDKVCGDGLTPRVVKELLDLGMVDEAHGRVDGWATQQGAADPRRPHRHGAALAELDDWPGWGATATRKVFDETIARTAQARGASWSRARRHRPLWRDASPSRGSPACLADADGREGEVRAPVVIAADGAGGPIAKHLGVHRRKDRPMAVAARTYYRSPRPTTSGSAPSSTSPTPTATCCRATAGSSRSTTGRSTSGSGCCRPRRSSRRSATASC